MVETATCVLIASSVWERTVNNGHRSNRHGRAYVEGMEDPVEIRFPGGNHFLVILRVEKSGECIPFVLLDDPPPDLRQRAAIGNIVNANEASRTDRR